MKTEVIDLDFKTRSRPHAAGAAVPQGRVRRRRHARRVAHAGAQPRAGQRRRSGALGRSALHALLPDHADGDRDGRQGRKDLAHQCAVCPPVPGNPQGRREPLDPVRRRRTRPRGAGCRDRRARPRARARSRRSRPRSAAPASAGAASTSRRSRRTTARPRPRSSTRSTPPSQRDTREPASTRPQKMKSVGQLAGGIAHDFNNVLSAIMMATDFLLNAHKPTDPSFQDIMQIKQNANRAASLVRQLLAFSRRQTLRPQVLDLGEALSDLGMLLKRLIGEQVALDVEHGARPLAGEGRHLPVRAGDRQSRGQCARRDARRRQGRDPHRAMSPAQDGRHAQSTRACRPPTTCWSRWRTPAPAFRPTSSRRSSSRSSRPRRSARDRARPLDRLRHRQADRRLHLSGVGGRQGHHVPHLPAAPRAGRRRDRRGEGGQDNVARSGIARHRRGSAASAPAKPRAATADLTGTARSCWSRTRKGCARSMPAG